MRFVALLDGPAGMASMTVERGSSPSRRGSSTGAVSLTRYWGSSSVSYADLYAVWTRSPCLSRTHRRWNSVGATSTGVSPSKSGSNRESHVSQLLLETLDRSVSRNSVQLSLVFCACIKGRSFPRKSCPQVDPHLWKRLCTSSRSNLHLLRGAAFVIQQGQGKLARSRSESGQY